MSSFPTSNRTLCPAPGYNLQDLLTAIRADETLSDRRRGEVASDLRCLAKVLGQPLGSIPARVPYLRDEMNKRTPAMAGLSPGRWRNVRSHVQFALAHSGLAKVPGRYRSAPSPAWQELLDKLVYGACYRLGHLARYCTSIEVEPGSLTDEVMAAFLVNMQEASLAALPERVHREAIIAWNNARAAHSDWPACPLMVPDNRQTYSIPLESFPASLRFDFDNWSRHLGGDDVFEEGDFKPLRPISVKGLRRVMHLYLSALVLEGIDVEELTSLADAVRPDRARIGLNFFWKRAGNKPSLHGTQIASALRSVARHWAKLDAADVDRLKALGRKISPAFTGMTVRNKERLRGLDDPDRVRALLHMPERIRADVVRAGEPTHSLAVRLQTAVMCEILIMVPVRLRNLANLQIGVHLLFGHRGEITLSIPGNEVKNGVSIEAALPTKTAELIALYVNRYRPLLPGSDGIYLFPSRSSVISKSHCGIRDQIKAAVRDVAGLDFTPHTFRHAAGKMVLDDNPGAHGQVQQMLGHKRISTTIGFYTGLEAKSALGHWDASVTRRRQADVLLAPRKGRRK